MQSPFRRALVAAAILAGILIPATSAFASTPPSTDGPVLAKTAVNTAVSVNEQNGTSTFHLSFRIARRSGAQVDVSNVAMAVSECTGCQSVAIAVQIDLVSPVPAVLNASNTAVAANIDCDICKSPNGFRSFPQGWTPANIKQALYDEGWRSVKAGWDHVCPQCMMLAGLESPGDFHSFLVHRRREYWRD